MGIIQNKMETTIVSLGIWGLVVIVVVGQPL